MDCLFCKMNVGEIPVNKVYEDEDFFIIKDINPIAKHHFLAIPKKHFKLLSDMTKEDAEMVSRILRKIPTLADALDLKNGYRLIINQGDDAGQSVFHLHIHILSGQKLNWEQL